MTTAQDASLLPIDAVPWRGAARMLRAAVRRHWLLTSSLTLVFAAAAAAAAAFLPRTYSGELRLMARRGTSVMSAQVNPRRAVAPGFDAPAQGAVEIGMSRATLKAIVEQGSLRAHWLQHRPAITRFKDSLRERMSGPVSAEALDDALIALLEMRLRVRVQDDVVSLRVTWSDAGAVPLILDQAQRAFVAERIRLDVESIEQSYLILQRASDAMATQMQGRVSAFQVARSRALGNQAAKIPVKVTSLSMSQLRDRLLERRAYREELERRNRMKRADLRVQLAQQAAELGPRHPDRMVVEQALARLDGNDEAINAAMAAEEEALKEYSARGGSLDILDADTPEEDPMGGNQPRADDDPTVIAARALLRMSADGLQDLAMRTENARIELETARAALPFKYFVTRPADRPRRPDAPNVPMLLIGGFVAGLMAGVMASLRRYIVVESARSGLGALALARAQSVEAAPAAA